MKEAILLKDLPDCKAGAIYKLSQDGTIYVNYEAIKTGSWGVKRELVENSPEWWTVTVVEDMQVFPEKDFPFKAQYDKMSAEEKSKFDKSIMSNIATHYRPSFLDTREGQITVQVRNILWFTLIVIVLVWGCYGSYWLVNRIL